MKRIKNTEDLAALQGHPHGGGKELGIYMGYDATVDTEMSEWSVLVFANNAKEARTIGWRAVKDVTEIQIPWTNMAIRKLKKNLAAIRKDADKEKLAAGIPHAIMDMSVCPRCNLWGEDGEDGTGFCGYCEGGALRA